jgi:hypothetical protein
VNVFVIHSFKNKEKKWEAEKNSMSERVARLERKMENEQRRRRKNNIVITGWRGEGKSKQQIKEDRKVYDSWFGSDSEQTWKKCRDNKRKQRRVSER